MKVEVLAEQLMHTDKHNVRSDYVRGQVFEMNTDDLEQQIAAGNVKPVAVTAEVSTPIETRVVKPAPAPKPAGTETK